MSSPPTLTITLPAAAAPLLALCTLQNLLLLGLALLWLRVLWHPHVPRVVLALLPEEAEDTFVPDDSGRAPSDPTIPCYDPATGALLKRMPIVSPAEVRQVVSRARAAHREWVKTSFAQRRQLLKIISRCVLDYSEDICRVSARDSGKTMVDAGFGEVLVTLEKISWLCSEGEAALKPERRSAGRVCFYKSARVEWHPRGVIGAIVPWNYPFHNILNPLTAAVFSGNAIVVKVSEHASWSSLFYVRLLQACLAAAGAPADLVQVVTGFAATGSELISAVDKLIFVGSEKVGKLVMASAAKTLTPVTLELGGKDPFVVLEGCKLDGIIPTALRAGFGAAGQNCMGAERFFIHTSLVGQFSDAVVRAAKRMRQGPPLNDHGNTGVDIGAMCMPGEAKRIHSIIEDAVRRGAKVLAGGALPAGAPKDGGHFYPPTVLLVPDGMGAEALPMRLLSEEIFGPVITIIPFETDEELVAMANDCPFALGSNIFGDDRRVRELGARIQAGMLASNDFATCYMCQSLPMGGLKDSGFGKFAGVEGLRALCLAKAVVEDRLSFLRTQVPPPLQYPLPPTAFAFIRGLMAFFYGHSLSAKLAGVVGLIRASLPPSAAKVKVP